MRKNKDVLQWSIILHSSYGIVGALFLVLGILDMMLYAINITYDTKQIYDWKIWAYPLLFLFISSLCFRIAIYNIKKSSRKFLNEIFKKRKTLEENMNKLEKGKIKDIDESLTSSEFGINNTDIEMEYIIKETGGSIPLLKEEIENSSFSYQQAISSLAKLSLLEYIRLPNKGLKITLSTYGLDVLELPRITFLTQIPEDIGLMIAHAELLYREKNYEEVILKCYNILERSLKIHLIPSIDDYVQKWNEKIDNTMKDKSEKKKEEFKWRGTKTKASLNDLWNFYRKYAKLNKKWLELTERVVKYTSEIERITNKSVDVIADVRSAHAHDKPTEKYIKDSYRILKLTELVTGVMFEEFRKKYMMRGRGFEPPKD